MLQMGISRSREYLADEWAARLTGIFLVATGVALVSVYIGLVLSWHASAPTGPMIILAAGFFYVISVLFGRAGGILRALPARKHLEA